MMNITDPTVVEGNVHFMENQKAFQEQSQLDMKQKNL